MTDTPKAGKGALTPGQTWAQIVGVKWERCDAFQRKSFEESAAKVIASARAPSPAPMATGREVDEAFERWRSGRAANRWHREGFAAGWATSPTRVGDGELRLQQAEQRIRDLAVMFGVPDGGRYLNDWKARAEKYQAALRASDAGGGEIARRDRELRRVIARLSHYGDDDYVEPDEADDHRETLARLIARARDISAEDRTPPPAAGRLPC